MFLMLKVIRAKKAGMYSEPQWRLSTTAQPRACCGDAVERSALEAAMRVGVPKVTEDPGEVNMMSLDTTSVDIIGLDCALATAHELDMHLLAEGARTKHLLHAVEAPPRASLCLRLRLRGGNLVLILVLVLLRF